MFHLRPSPCCIQNTATTFPILWRWLNDTHLTKHLAPSFGGSIFSLIFGSRQDQDRSFWNAFSFCHGKYECPPERYHTSTVLMRIVHIWWTSRKKKRVSISGLVLELLWYSGILGFCEINICIGQLLAPVDDSGQNFSIAAFDLIMSISFGMVGIIVPFLAFYLTRYGKNPCCRRKKEAEPTWRTDWRTNPSKGKMQR